MVRIVKIVKKLLRLSKFVKIVENGQNCSPTREKAQQCFCSSTRSLEPTQLLRFTSAGSVIRQPRATRQAAPVNPTVSFS